METPVVGSNNNSVVKHLRLIVIVIGLLMAEFCLQSIYYQQRHEKSSSALGWYMDTAAVEVPKSDKFISALDLKQCVFPVYFEKSQFNFKLKNNAFVEPGKWRERNKKFYGLQDAKHVHKFLVKTENNRKQALEKNPKLPPLKRNITFVHIGKAGGSTIACSLRWGRQYIQNHCDNIDYDAIDNYDPKTAKRPYIPESAISRHVNCYTHWRMHLSCMYMHGDHPFSGMDPTKSDRNPFGSRRLLEGSKQPVLPKRHNDFLVNLRSPLDRIASWFTYEHIENHGIVYKDRQYHCGQVVLGSCYRHFEHLTTIGLGFPRPSPNQPLKVGTNLSATECSHWAWAAVQGNMPADYHNAFNYEWYAHRLLDDSLNSQADMFVLRVEHLEQDWTTVDRMLGGTGAFPSTLASRQNSAEIKPLRVPNHNTTDLGILNLCRALCEEIQVYKRFLLAAVNLSPGDVQASGDELRQRCPEERDVQPRVCPKD
ncbi:expressed unknown protein [Seminavis robusta]|uniref:Uncharacterized protein n=1 Tax=Seminavis robusta TaxID=568900 RepID=A0A9N8HGY7_9STRA|nr:expressed unknown protein [Seminavis robusta]|eukprot:Sro421_g139460.1 n/a (482) ;mRNA; f:12344-14069